MIKPLPGYVLIEPVNDEEQLSSSGLYKPEKAKEKPMKGKILAKGAYDKDASSLVLYEAIQENTMVIFHRWSGQDVIYKDKEYKLVKFSDIMGIYD